MVLIPTPLALLTRNHDYLKGHTLNPLVNIHPLDVLHRDTVRRGVEAEPPPPRCHPSCLPIGFTTTSCWIVPCHHAVMAGAGLRPSFVQSSCCIRKVKVHCLLLPPLTRHWTAPSPFSPTPTVNLNNRPSRNMCCIGCTPHINAMLNGSHPTTLF